MLGMDVTKHNEERAMLDRLHVEASFVPPVVSNDPMPVNLEPGAMNYVPGTEPKAPAGVKYDGDKLRMELLPPELLTGVAAVLGFGAAKYADRNWELGIKYGRVYGALLRHLTAWWGGEDTDPETGMSHLWHAGCCNAFLIAYEARGMTELDDRPDAGRPEPTGNLTQHKGTPNATE